MAKPNVIDLNLNLTELGKQKDLFVEGKKGVYGDIRLIELEDKQYNDYMAVMKVSKEDYEKGVRGAIVGYAKDWSLRNGGKSSDTASSGNAANDTALNKDNLPF